MSEAYKQDESWIELQSKLGGHKEWLHAQAIMRVEIAPVNVAAVRDLVDALEVLCRVGIEVEATLAARDAELASLRLRYREAVLALDRWRMWGGTGPQCSGTVAQFFIRDTAVMMTKDALSMPEAIAILKEGQS